MKLLLTTSMILSVSMLVSTHPIMIMVLILTQALNICMLTWMLSNTSWLAFTLFIIFLGGLMVLFIYISSLTPNEKLELTFTKLIKQNKMLFLLMSIIMISSMMTYSTNQYPNLTQKNMMMFSSGTLNMTMMVMIYLLVALVISVNISSTKMGPIRNLSKK